MSVSLSFTRLGTRLLLRVLLVSAVFTLLLTSLYAVLVWRAEVSNEKARIEEIRRNQLPPLIDSLWSLDKPRIALQLEVISRTLPGAWIALEIPQDTGFQAGAAVPPAGSTTQSIPLFRSNNSAAIGTLHIAPDPALARDRVRRSVESDLLLQISLIALFAAAVTYFMHRLIVRRLGELSNFAQNNLDPSTIEANAHIAPPAPTTRNLDEIDMLGDTLDNMRQRILREMRASRALQGELSRQALHDPLTGLGNRNHLSTRSRELLHACGEQELAFAFLDVDRLKLINDSLGHAVGDQLLRAMARRMEAALPPHVEIFRPASDEFLLLIPDPRGKQPLEQIVADLQTVMNAAFPIENHVITVTTTIGVAVAPGHGSDLSSLLKHADIALQAAKKQGRGHTCYFEPSLLSSLNERVAIESLLRHALERGEFEVHYQPQIDLENGRITGAEALLRWNNPQVGLIGPDRFIPIAEDSGQIIAIGAWVLQTACKEARRWQSAGIEGLSLSVNLSAVQLRHNGLLQSISQALEYSGLAAADLEVEVTESVIMNNVFQASDRLAALRRLGIRIAIDDFGTGYSSMAYLKYLPIDRLKIDRAFITDIPDDANDTAIATAIIRLAEALNLTVIAEGVEKAEQAELLLGQGCREAQGYYFARPMSAEAFLAYALAAQTRTTPV